MDNNVLVSFLIGVAVRLVCELILKVTYYTAAKIKNKKENDVPPKDHRS